jgi:hypothetical protein
MTHEMMEKIVQKCIVIASLDNRRAKLVVKKIKNVAMLEGRIVREVKALKDLLGEDER